jgi:uncharacterized protein YbbC (DUF1343 family)
MSIYTRAWLLALCLANAALAVTKQPPQAIHTGLDVLVERRFGPLAGKRIGLVTNHTGVDRNRTSVIDLFARSPVLKLVALFSPEHGIRGLVDCEVSSSRDTKTGLPIYSLYGDTRRPTPKMLAGIDVLVFDIQDIGARFYTYITTMGYCMEAAAKAHIPIYVLDRANPIAGVRVEGPVMAPKLISFTGYHTIPARHGMTAGELALMFNEEKGIRCDLTVVAVKGWNRSVFFEETGCPWVNTSPNIRSPIEALLYVGVGALESTNLSVGRGTTIPFEVVGAPWINGRALARTLTARGLPGVRIVPVQYTPTASVYKGRPCQGVRFIVTDRAQLDSIRLGLEVASALYHLCRDRFEVKSYAGMIGQDWVVDRIKAGIDPVRIIAEWEPGLAKFRQRRAKYLIYK